MMKGYRIVLINSALATLALAAEIASWLTAFDWGAWLPPQYALWVIVTVNVANIILRFVTTTPVGRSQ
jgi:hypothetical protein